MAFSGFFCADFVAKSFFQLAGEVPAGFGSRRTRCMDSRKCEGCLAMEPYAREAPAVRMMHVFSSGRSGMSPPPPPPLLSHEPAQRAVPRLPVRALPVRGGAHHAQPGRHLPTAAEEKGPRAATHAAAAGAGVWPPPAPWPREPDWQSGLFPSPP